MDQLQLSKLTPEEFQEAFGNADYIYRRKMHNWKMQNASNITYLIKQLYDNKTRYPTNELLKMTKDIVKVLAKAPKGIYL